MKPTQNTLDLCDRAATMLRAAGFIFVNVSMKTEACYYRWPDRPHLLRIAAHRLKNPPIGLGPVVSKITFNGTHVDRPGMMKIADPKVDAVVEQAIGRYFLRSAFSNAGALEQSSPIAPPDPERKTDG